MTVALVAVSALTVVLVGVLLLVPLDRKLRDDAVASLTETARSTRASLSGLDVGNADRLREEEIGLGVEAGQALACVGERPAVDVTPRLEHPQHTVELAREAVVATPDASLQPLDVPTASR